MSWGKREPTTNLVILGDDEGCVQKAGGLLVRMIQDQQYPQRQNYELVQRNGDSIMLAGSASLSRQIFPGDVGKFLKAEFLGWGKSANGKFKQIEVNIWEGDPTEDMKKWPRFGETTKPAPEREKAKAKARDDDFSDFPEAVDEDDGSGLPF
jgi:hypothetical protein